MRNFDRFKNANEARDCFISENTPNVKLCEVDFGSVRANNTVRNYVGSYLFIHKKDKRFSDLAISEFCEFAKKKDILRVRNCGKHTFAEINYTLKNIGFEIGNPMPINLTDAMFVDWLFANCGDGCAKDVHANGNVAKLKFKLLNENAKLPCYAHEGDSGMDVFAAEDVGLMPLDYSVVSTGIAAVIPDGFELQVRPRSGMSSRGVVAAFGTVDSGYRGEIKVTIYNHNGCEKTVLRGDRIAQLVLAPVTRAEIEQVEELDTNTERGTDGFGSTGR